MDKNGFPKRRRSAYTIHQVYVALELHEQVDIMRMRALALISWVESYIPFDTVTRNALLQVCLESHEFAESIVDELVSEYINSLPAYVVRISVF